MCRDDCCSFTFSVQNRKRVHLREKSKISCNKYVAVLHLRFWNKLVFFLVLESYIAVGKPLKYSNFMKRRRVIQMVLTSWGIPFLFSLTVSLEAIRFNSDDRIRTVPGYFCLLFEVMLCMILTFCLASKFLVVYKQNSRDRTIITQLQFNQRVTRVKTRNMSAVKWVALVTCVFLSCYRIFMRCTFKRSQMY